jgi:hypothetical protein
MDTAPVESVTPSGRTENGAATPSVTVPIVVVPASVPATRNAGASGVAPVTEIVMVCPGFNDPDTVRVEH